MRLCKQCGEQECREKSTLCAACGNARQHQRYMDEVAGKRPTKLCPRCKNALRVPGSSYCADCKRRYDRVRVRKAKGLPGEGRAHSDPGVRPVRDSDTKYCRGCGRVLVLAQFYRDKSTRDGVTTRCKQCCDDKTREWNQRNRQAVAARRRRYYWKHAAEMRAKAAARKARRQREKIERIQKLLTGVRE